MRWLALPVAVVALAACNAKPKDKPKGESKPGRPEPMTPVERKRGEDACTTYSKALCDCAAKRPDDANLAEQCELKKAKPEALELLLGVDDDPATSDDSRLRAQIEARKLIARCVTEHASIGSLGCPAPR